MTIGRVRASGKHWQAHLQEMTNYVSACAKALDPLKNPHMVLLGKSIEVIQTGKKNKLHICGVQSKKKDSAKFVQLFDRFGSLNMQIRNNFKNIIFDFIACKLSRICDYYVNSMVVSCSTCKKEEKECMWVKHLIYAVLSQFQICCNLLFSPAKSVFPKFRAQKQMFFPSLQYSYTTHV